MTLDVAMIALVAVLAVIAGVQIAALRVAYDTNRRTRQIAQHGDDVVRMTSNGTLAVAEHGPARSLFAETAAAQAAADVREHWQGSRTEPGDPLADCGTCLAPIALTAHGWRHLPGHRTTDRPHPAEPPVGLGGQQ